MVLTNKLVQIYADSPLAVAYITRDDDAQWSLEWQNAAAAALWGNHDLDADLELKLYLLEAYQRSSPFQFVYSLQDSVKTFHFTLTHYQQGVLLHFTMAQTAASSSEVEDENLNQSVIEAAGLGVFDWDLESGVARYSDKLYQLCDVSPVGLGSNLADFKRRIHPQDLLRFEDALFAHIEARWPFNINFRFKSSVDSYVWMQATGQAFWHGHNQKATRLVGSLRDISDNKRMEQTVRQREALIEQIIDALPVGVYVKDPQGCYRFFNREAERQVGIVRNKALGRTDFEIYPLEQARQLVSLDQVVKQRGEVIIGEQEVFSEGGSHWLMTGRGPLSVMRQDQSQETWMLGFALDITERREMEEVLRQARLEAEMAAKAKSEFLSVMSHEIRTPLNSVIGTSGLLMDTDLVPEQKQHVEMIKRAGEHLLHLINDILDFNKLDAGEIALERHAFSLREQIQTALSIVTPQAEAKSLSVVSKLPEDMVTFIWGDEARLRQILLNLLGNAIKFTHEGLVELAVECDVSRQKLRFEIRDSGIGIASDKLDKLFLKFSQADASTTRKYGGTGLGLSISKKLVEAMGGVISVESELGRGSVFWFELPFEVATEMDVVKENLGEDYDSQRPLSILVAEDNPPNQLLIRAILNRLGHEVVIAENGIKVLDVLTRQLQHFDLVLMDMQMPEMDGLEATRQIRQLSDAKLASIPIIALTANALAGDRQRVLDAGMDAYLSKPIDINALKRTLWQWSQSKL